MEYRNVDQFMRNTFKVMFCLLYLFTGIGFGTSTHYCEMSFNPETKNCCCSEGESAETTASSNNSRRATQPCCETEYSDSAATESLQSDHAECCEIESQYHQTAASPKPCIDSEWNFLTTSFCPSKSAETPFNWQLTEKETNFHPYSHFNRPLLI